MNVIGVHDWRTVGHRHDDVPIVFFRFRLLHHRLLYRRHAQALSQCFGGLNHIAIPKHKLKQIQQIPAFDAITSEIIPNTRVQIDFKRPRFRIMTLWIQSHPLSSLTLAARQPFRHQNVRHRQSSRRHLL